jgi:hypothetical protein
MKVWFGWFMVLNATLINNIQAISWRKLEYPGKNLSQITDKLYHIMICRFLVVGNIFRLETCMNSLVKVPLYSKLNFQGEIFFTQNWCNITLKNHVLTSDIIFIISFIVDNSLQKPVNQWDSYYPISI